MQTEVPHSEDLEMIDSRTSPHDVELNATSRYLSIGRILDLTEHDHGDRNAWRCFTRLHNLAMKSIEERIWIAVGVRLNSGGTGEPKREGNEAN